MAVIAITLQLPHFKRLGYVLKLPLHRLHFYRCRGACPDDQMIGVEFVIHLEVTLSAVSDN